MMAFMALQLAIIPVNSKNCVSFSSGQECPLLHSTDRGQGDDGKSSGERCAREGALWGTSENLAALYHLQTLQMCVDDKFVC